MSPKIVSDLKTQSHTESYTYTHKNLNKVCAGNEKLYLANKQNIFQFRGRGRAVSEKVLTVCG